MPFITNSGLLRPLRDYNEKDVINLFTFSGQSTTAQVINKGTLVAICGSQGFRNDADPVNIIGTYGDFSVNNVQALRYGTPAQVTWYGTGNNAQGFPGENALGITLFDTRDLDENTIPLKYNLRKAAEIEACISGQSVPIVVRGTFLYSGLTGSFKPGAALYGGVSGSITAYPGALNTLGTGTGATFGPGLTGTIYNSQQVGIALGVTGADGSCLIRLNVL